MIEAYVTRVQDRVQALAKEYEGQGYDVVVEPSPHTLPDFLAGYRPDLIVAREGKTTIIEVKSRQSLAAEAQARELAQLVNGKPGWSFELILVSGEPAAPFDATAFDRADVQRSLEEARDLVANGFTGPALLSGWGTLEATLRLFLSAEGVEPHQLTPAHLLKQAVGEGVISREEHRALSDLMKHRNALAHGFQNEAIGPALVSSLLDLTEKLLNETSSYQSA